MYVTLWNLRWTSDPWTLHASLWEKRMSLVSNNMLPLSGLWSLWARAEHHCCTPRQSASGFALTDFEVSHHFHGPSSSDGTAECALRSISIRLVELHWAPGSLQVSACLALEWNSRWHANKAPRVSHKSWDPSCSISSYSPGLYLHVVRIWALRLSTRASNFRPSGQSDITFWCSAGIPTCWGC